MLQELRKRPFGVLVIIVLQIIAFLGFLGSAGVVFLAKIPDIFEIVKGSPEYLSLIAALNVIGIVAAVGLWSLRRWGWTS